MSRPPNKPLPLAARLNFLLGGSDKDLSDFELARLAEVAILRSDLHAILDKLIDQMAEAAVAGWFRQTTREKLKQALETLENPEERINEVTSWAKERIKDGQRSEEDLIPRTSLPPGAAHLAAALRYAERNIAEGKCRKCPQPLDPRSHGYCTKHLAMQRERHTPKRKRVEPGTLAWLYGESLAPGDGRSTPKVYQKHRRLTAAGKDLLKRIAKECGATYEHVRRVAIGDIRSDRIAALIMKEVEAAPDRPKKEQPGKQLEDR